MNLSEHWYLDDDGQMACPCEARHPLGPSLVGEIEVIVCNCGRACGLQYRPDTILVSALPFVPGEANIDLYATEAIHAN